MTDLTATETRSEPPTDTPRPRLIAPRKLNLIRWIAVAVWAVVVGYRTKQDGVAFDRNLLMVYIFTGLLAASIGRRRIWTVLRDWLPFAAVLVVYDLSRGAARLVGRPTEWRTAIDFDRWLFRVEPTTWLQSQLKEPFAPWWEVGVSIVYVSYFFAPYLVAGVLWLRDRSQWRRFVLRFVAISFLALIGFVAYPAAPPWAASQCSAAQVAGGPDDPPCMEAKVGTVTDGGILGKVTPAHGGAAPYVERISSRGWNGLGFTQAKALVDEGQAGANEVAAVPSLHAAVSGLISVFFWPRVRKRWRPLLAAYALAMGFSLVYSGEHYVFDILLGWLLTGLVCFGFNRWERRKQDPPAGQRGLADPVSQTDILDGPIPARP